jgi:hypothetical protein
MIMVFIFQNSFYNSPFLYLLAHHKVGYICGVKHIIIIQNKKNMYNFTIDIPKYWQKWVLFLGFVLLIPSLRAQDTTCIIFRMPAVPVQHVGDTVEIPIIADNLIGFLGMQFGVYFEESQLQFVGVDYTSNPLGIDPSFQSIFGNCILFSYVTPGNLIDVPNGSTLFSLKFKVLDTFDTSPIKFGPPNVPGTNVIEIIIDDKVGSFALLDGLFHFGNLPNVLPDVLGTCIHRPSINGSACGSLYNVDVISVDAQSFEWEGPDNFVSSQEDLFDVGLFGEIIPIYSLNMTSANGSLSRKITISLAPLASPLAVNLINTTPLCAPEVCLSASISGGTLPYSILWSNGFSGQVNNCFNTADPIFFSVVGGDGCVAYSDTIVWTPTPTIAITSSITHYNCATGQLGSYVPIAVSPNSAYSFLFSTPPSPVDPWFPINLYPGTYFVTVVDQTSGCSKIESYVIIDEGSFTDQLELSHTCNADNTGDLLLSATALPSTIEFPVQINWSSGSVQQIDSFSNDTLSVLAEVPDGPYWVSVTSLANGCNSMYYTQIDCPPFAPPAVDSVLFVWPGDADNNNAVNHHDLLYIGLGMGAAGPTRSGASLDWLGQPADDWAQSTPTNTPVNYKNLDCNGDGAISLADTLGLYENWGKVVQVGVNNPFATPDPMTSVGDPVSLYLESSVVEEGITIGLPIALGSADIPANDLYGLSFSIAYNPEYIKPLYFQPLNSWLGEPQSNLATVYKNFQVQGRMDVAITRTDGATTDGWGVIGRWFIIIEDEIFAKEAKRLKENGGLDTILSKVFLSNVYATGTGGKGLKIETTTANIVLVNTPSGTVQPLDNTYALVPNPATDMVQLVGEGPTVRHVTVFSADGAQKYDGATNGNTRVAIENWSSGLYFARLITHQGIIVKSFVVR